MALRVLLADESPTIKKVFQLSLQDYGVEVKAVNIGVDVIDVAKSFKPDIIFADVLLQQLSGYQVSAELKVNSDFSNVPIVLMWSGFMEIDEDKFLASHADAKLEKPFEVDKLRELIHKLVPKVQSQKLSEYLEFPSLPEFETKKTRPDHTLQNPPPLPIEPSPPKNLKDKNSLNTQSLKKELEQADTSQAQSNWNMEEFESIDITKQMPSREPQEELIKNEQFLTSSEDENSDWIQSNINNFRLDIDVNDNLNVEEDEIPAERVVSSQAVEAATRSSSLIPPLPLHENTQDPDDIDLEIEKPSEDLKAFDASMIPQLSEDRLMEIIKAQSAEIIENVVWKIVPELATQVIERELHRLLEEKINDNKHI